jgi:hypothetical protein
MPIYTLCSTDCDHYNEIIVTIPYYNCEKSVDLTVLSFCTLFNVELLNDNDFMDIIINDGQLFHINCFGMGKLDAEGVAEYLINLMKIAGLENFVIELSQLNTLRFIYNQPFTIVNMSYNLKIVTGFYYLNEVDNFPVIAEKNNDNEYIINVKAAPFCNSTPVLYLLSNTGGNCYRMNLDKNNLETGTISMIINNSFNAGMPALYQKADITTRVYNSDLTFMRMVLTDCNLKPIKLLNPMFVTLQVTDVADG